MCSAVICDANFVGMIYEVEPPFNLCIEFTLFLTVRLIK